MTTYTITVNGKEYDVSVVKNKAMTGAAGSKASKVMSTTPAAPAAATVVAAPAAPAPAPAPASGKGQNVTAMMPGKVVSVSVNVGDTVKKGQELLIVEAMKMHNPITSPVDGVVQSISVKAGDPVQTGTTLASVG